MIELRWKQKGLMSVARHGTAVIGEETGKPNLVLEYRVQTNIFEPVSPPLWGPWIEVPIVFE